ncbi:MAG: hypothetical protein GY856_44030, partial [bacterium]|nr:hypothetical protein [bacterium]
MQHRTVADRIIDEMERELTALLRREEDRPFAHYRYFYVPDEAPAPVIQLTRSPLAAPPEEAFIVGYFQIDPDGTVNTPLWPRNEALAATATGWQPTPEIAAVVTRVEETVGKLWSGNGVRDLAEAATPRAGITVPLPKRQNARSEEDAAEQGVAAEQESDSQQSYLSSLNKAVRSRKERSAKVATTQAPTVYDFSQADANLLRSTIQSRQQQQVAAEEPAAELWAATDELRAEIEGTLATAASATIDVRLEPMVGRLADADQLVLYRTVLIADKAYRQGLVLEADALMSRLAERVLADGELASRARIVKAAEAPAASSPGYSYLHRFAEPFGSVARVIALDPLPELAGTTTLYSMSILLAVAATFGLFALYRMVAVVVDYAERRTNFVSAVTHELKTPLTAIRMYGEML